MTQHRKLKNKQHKPHQKHGVISGAPKGKADPAPQMFKHVMYRHLMNVNQH